LLVTLRSAAKMFSFRSAADRAKDNQTPAEQVSIRRLGQATALGTALVCAQLKDWQRRMKRDQITLQAEITSMWIQRLS